MIKASTLVNKFLKMNNKKGQTIDLVSGTVIAFLSLILIIFVVLYAISAINPTGFFTTNSGSANATLNLQNNLTEGSSVFGGYIPTVMKVLAIVLVLAAILFLVVFVQRMRGGGSQAAL